MNSLVLLMACESAATTVDTLNDFAMAFRAAGASAIVGTEVPVYSSLAHSIRTRADCETTHSEACEWYANATRGRGAGGWSTSCWRRVIRWDFCSTIAGMPISSLLEGLHVSPIASVYYSRPLRIAYCVVLTLLLAVSARRAAAAEAPWISVPGSAQLRIVDDTADQSLPVWVTLNAIAGGDVTLDKIMVLHDGTPLSNEAGAGIDVDSKLSATAGTWLANIKVKAGKVTYPGTYEVWVSASKPDHADSQTLKISIEHPAATVTLLAPDQDFAHRRRGGSCRDAVAAGAQRPGREFESRGARPGGLSQTRRPPSMAT